MTILSRLAPAFLALAFSAAVAQAAPATPEEASRLKTLFERYLGHPGPGDAPSVTVTPDGDAYRASFDLKQMAKPLGGFGMSVDEATQTFRLTPNNDGTWKVSSDAMPPITFHVKDQTITMRSGAYSFDGIFDPKLGAFTNGKAIQDSASFDQDSAASSQHRRIGRLEGTQTAAPGTPGTTSIKGGYTLSDVTDEMSMSPPRPAASVAVTPSTPPFKFSYTMPKSAVDVALGNLQMTKLLDIWAFLVAHPDHDALVAAQEELRGLVRTALPLMSDLKEGGSADDLAVTTQVGVFSAHRIASDVAFNGLDGAGTMAMNLNLDGLKVPSQDLPVWSVGFLPTALELKPTLTGFHFDEMMREVVSDVDLKASQPFTPEQQAKIGQIVWPGNGKLTIAPSRITSGLLDIRFQGEGTISDAPEGKMTVSAAGLDKAITALQKATASDPSAQQILAQFILAKNLAKPGPDGGYIWEIEASASGPVTVNGTPLQ